MRTQTLVLTAALLTTLTLATATPAGAVRYENDFLPGPDPNLGPIAWPGPQTICGPAWNGWNPAGCVTTPPPPGPPALPQRICGPTLDEFNPLGCVYL